MKRITKGAAIFEQSSRSGRSSTSPGINWPVYVYSDATSAVGKAFDDGRPVHGLHGATVVSAVHFSHLSPDGHLSMLFEGSFGGEDGGRLKAPILLDSGAITNFVSPSLLKQLAISFTSSSAKLKLADNSEAPILGKVRLRFKLQNFTATVSCFVTDLCEEFDLILGNSFMSSQRAILDYSNFYCLFS